MFFLNLAVRKIVNVAFYGLRRVNGESVLVWCCRCPLWLESWGMRVGVGVEAATWHLLLDEYVHPYGNCGNRCRKWSRVCRRLDSWEWVGVFLEECWLGELELLSAKGIPVTQASSDGLVIGRCYLLVQWSPNPNWAGVGFGIWEQIEILQKEIWWETRDGLFMAIKDSSTNYASLLLFSAPKPAHCTFRGQVFRNARSASNNTFLPHNLIKDEVTYLVSNIKIQ